MRVRGLTVAAPFSVDYMAKLRTMLEELTADAESFKRDSVVGSDEAKAAVVYATFQKLFNMRLQLSKNEIQPKNFRVFTLTMVREKWAEKLKTIETFTEWSGKGMFGDALTWFEGLIEALTADIPEYEAMGLALVKKHSDVVAKAGMGEYGPDKASHDKLEKEIVQKHDDLDAEMEKMQERLSELDDALESLDYLAKLRPFVDVVTEHREKRQRVGE